MKSPTTLLLTVLSLNSMGSSDCAEQAEQILESAGIRGGLVVHLGCGDGSLTAALRVLAPGGVLLRKQIGRAHV